MLPPKFFIHQQMHFLLILENTKIYIKTYITIAPTCFGLRPSSGGLHLSIAKVTRMSKQWVKLRRYVLRGGVAACCHKLSHHRITHFTVCFNVSVTLAMLKCKLPDDGRRPKHVGAIVM
jgi:hypothetical protein